MSENVENAGKWPENAMAGKWKIEDFAATDRMIQSYLLLRGYKNAEKGLSHDLALLNGI